MVDINEDIQNMLNELGRKPKSIDPIQNFYDKWGLMKDARQNKKEFMNDIVGMLQKYGLTIAYDENNKIIDVIQPHVANARRMANVAGCEHIGLYLYAEKQNEIGQTIYADGTKNVFDLAVRAKKILSVMPNDKFVEDHKREKGYKLIENGLQIKFDYVQPDGLIRIVYVKA